MKTIKMLMIAIILLLLSSPMILSAHDSTFVEFSITAEKNYQASKLILKLSIESENKSFTVASENCNNIVNNLKIQLEGLIASGKIEFRMHNYNSFPVSTFFKDYFKVTANLDIVIKDKEAMGKVFDIVTKKEDLKLVAIDFQYDDINDIENELIKEVSSIAEKKVKSFEDNFHFKLNLISITQNSYNQLFYQSKVNSINSGFTIRGSRENETQTKVDGLDVSELYPEKSFNLTLNFRYKIVK